MPCFEGLFFETCDSTIQDLLFTLAFWHGYAKLQLHSSSSVQALEGATRVFGMLIRKFAKVICPRYPTKLTPCEQAAKARRQAKKHAGSNTNSALDYAFNISTPKLHAMGDYPSSIRFFGTTDSYSPQNVMCCAHVHLPNIVSG
jgi:hypothetical protein